MMMRRSPLLRMAAIGGVAYMGSKAGANKANAQAQQAQAQQPAAETPPPPPPAATPPPPDGATSGATDRISQLKELAELHDSGALTQEEFDKEKTRILA
ncbi:MAG TPA: SHOCT domain-containing protein [Acidimicrobiales bacterium]|nr:SHOCT domain-containing protein [Acidimicrobiales bacterium]